jgi:eukaryotic-like serine/threonine-protein kinase
VGESVAADVVCQACGKSWPADVSVCPNDGTWLHEETIMEIAKPRTKGPTMDPFGLDATDPSRKLKVRQTDLAPSAFKTIGDQGELAPGSRVSEYEIEAKIGEGAMGMVYRAIHTAIHKQVAIKIMTPKLFDAPESVKRFVAEARAIASIGHPGIVDVFGFGRVADGRAYLVMELLEGTSLSDRMKQGRLPLDEACEIVRQVARSLEAAHASDVVHRDLKPENVFILKGEDDRPRVKLLDFGLAKQTNNEDGLVARTRTGQLLGTPLYMSPEQCKSKGVDHRTDIYALGCMCYELFCGRVPFDCDNIAELISAHLVNEPPRPSELAPDISPELDKLLFAMIAKDPGKRPGLGEIRRIVGMQTSRPSQPILAAQPREDVTPAPSPPPAASPVAETESPAGVVVSATGPRRWLVLAAVLFIIAVGAALLTAMR